MTSQRPMSLTPHLFVRDADAAVAFYRTVFGATELLRNILPDGRVLFVELAVGPARLLVSEETPSLGALAPPTIGGSPVLLHLEVQDPDAVARQAIDLGAVVEMPVQEMFWASATASCATPTATAGRSPPPASSSPPTTSPAAPRPTSSPPRSYPRRAEPRAEGARMTDEHALEHVAKAIIDASLYMVLGTADHAGRPWVTPVYYAPAGYREFLWVSEPDAKHSGNLGERGEVSIVIFDSSVPIDTGQAVYVSASARELTGEECAKGIDIYSHRTLAHGGREWKPEDVQAPARHRLYRADAVALYVLDPQDRRVLVTIEKGAAEAAS